MSREQEPERPRAEPEIIPPGQDLRSHEPRMRRAPDGVFVHIGEDDRLSGGVYVARPGLASVLLGFLIIGLIVAAVFFLLAGLVLVVVPLVVAALAFWLLSGTVRHYSQRLQAWWAGQ